MAASRPFPVLAPPTFSRRLSHCLLVKELDTVPPWAFLPTPGGATYLNHRTGVVKVDAAGNFYFFRTSILGPPNPVEPMERGEKKAGSLARLGCPIMSGS